MSTPSEGPGAWQQGSHFEASDWLRNLSPQQQQNLMMVVNMTPEQAQKLDRVLNKEPLKARVHAAIGNAVGRVHLVYQQTTDRLSERAQALASQANQYRQAAVDRATQAGQQVAATYRDTRDAVVDRAAQAGQQVAATYRDTRDAVVDRATQAGQQVAATYRDTRDAVVDMAQRGQVRLDQAWQTGTDRLNQAGQTVAQGARDARDAVTARGRQAVAAGQQFAGRVGRWFQDTTAKAQLRAEGARAAFDQFKFDPTVPGVMNQQERLEMSQRFSQALSSNSLESRTDILRDMYQSSQAQLDAKTASKALSGIAPASQAPGRGEPVSPQQGNDGAQQQTGAAVTKNTKGAENLR